MMLITRTPMRISLFGGGTDYPEYFSKHRGAVIGLTIDKYIYIAALRMSGTQSYKYRLAYSQVETVDTVEQLEHRAVVDDRRGPPPQPPLQQQQQQRQQLHFFKLPRPLSKQQRLILRLKRFKRTTKHANHLCLLQNPRTSPRRLPQTNPGQQAMHLRKR